MAPAAVRLHHAEPGGLVRHLVEVGSAGLALLDPMGKPAGGQAEGEGRDVGRGGHTEDVEQQGTEEVDVGVNAARAVDGRHLGLEPQSDW